MKIYIALYGSEKELCNSMQKMLVQIFDEKKLAYEIDIFHEGEELCESMKQKAYDILFLDIELPNMGGAERERYVREWLGNEDVHFVHISAKESYSGELPDDRSTDFLIKPITYAGLQKVIEKYFIALGQAKAYFEYKKGYEHYKIPLSDILYFEIQKRKVVVNTTYGSDAFYGRMGDICFELRQSSFLLIHKSILVNYEKIKTFCQKCVILQDGTELPISQAKRKEIREQYHRYVAKGRF